MGSLQICREPTDTLLEGATLSASPRGKDLVVILAFSVAPSGGESSSDGSVSEAVAQAVAVVRASGLPHRTSSMFTEIEGDWDEVFDVVKRATEAVAKFGSRVSLVMKADIRPGFTGELDGKLERLERAIEGGAPGTPARGRHS